MKTLALLFPLFIIAVVAATAAGRDMPEHIRLPTSVSNASRSNDDSILDVEGNKVEIGTRYYLVSVLSGAGGGGVKWGPLNTLERCRSDVLQSPDDHDLGDPVEFIPEDESDTVITASKNILVTFNSVSSMLCVCRQAWSLRFDPVLTSGVLKTDDMSDAPKKFRIQPVDQELGGYKLTFCPVNDSCTNVGRYFDRESTVRRLALVEDPFVFVIQKVDYDY